MPDSPPVPHETIQKSRLEALSDGIFAFAMTLLVIGLAVPVIPYEDAPALLPGIIAGMHSQFLIFTIAFFILAGYWLSHHRILSPVKYVDEHLIWINFGLLFLVVLIPFTTALSGDYVNVLEAVLLFHLNLLAASLTLTLLWGYIMAHYATFNPGAERPASGGRQRALAFPFASLLAIAVSFVDTSASMWCYALIPVVLFLVKLKRLSVHGPAS